MESKSRMIIKIDPRLRCPACKRTMKKAIAEQMLRQERCGSEECSFKEEIEKCLSTNDEYINLNIDISKPKPSNPTSSINQDEAPRKKGCAVILVLIIIVIIIITLYKSCKSDKETISKTDINNDRNSISNQFTISDLDFHNEDASGNIIGSYGMIFESSALKYLTFRIKYTNTGSAINNKILYIKIIKPDGSTFRNDSSPTNYTRSTIVNIQANTKNESLNIGSWGGVGGGFYSPGEYTCEVWSDDKMLISKKVTVQKKPDPW